MRFGRRRPAAEPPPPLPVPPFAADPPAPDLVDVPAPADPVALLAAAGVQLPPGGQPSRPTPWLSVWTVPVAGPAAISLWEQVRAVHPRTGLWPVLADQAFQERLEDGQDDAATPPVAGDGAAWLTAQAARPQLDLARVGRGQRPDLLAVADWRPLATALDGEFDRLVLVPAPASWLVPGLLGWSGAVNEHVMGDEHATVLRRWAGAWQAELLALEGDVVTLRVLAPPAAPEPALGAAVEAYLYCPDAVEQGAQTLEALAERLVQPVWQFWWD